MANFWPGPVALLATSLEDLLGVVDQPDVPGTIDERHPDWRRQLPVAIDEDDVHPWTSPR